MTPMTRCFQHIRFEADSPRVTITLQGVVSRYGTAAKAKLSNVVVSEEPEDPLREPLEFLLSNLAEFGGFRRRSVCRFT